MAIEQIIQGVLTADEGKRRKITAILEDRELHPVNTEPELKLITFVEAAQRLGVGRTTVWRLYKDGKLKVRNVRGKNRITLASVINYAKGGVE